VDYEKARELLLYHLRYSGGMDLVRAHETHHDDAVLEFPQSGERFVGKANILGFRQRYPARVDYEPRRLRGSGDLWVLEGRGFYDGDETSRLNFVWIVEFRDELVQHETIYFGEPFPAPDWRRPWAEAGATWERQADLPDRLPERG
jgi:SnoaL-like protein